MQTKQELYALAIGALGLLTLSNGTADAVTALPTLDTHKTSVKAPVRKSGAASKIRAAAVTSHSTRSAAVTAATAATAATAVATTTSPAAVAATVNENPNLLPALVTVKPGTAVAQKQVAKAVPSNAVSAVAPTFTSATTQPGARRVSLDFVAADISEVLKALALQSGINIILATNGSSTGAGGAGGSGAIQDKITVSLKKVSFAEALDTVVNLSGYRYARIGDTYAVGPPEAVAALARGSSVGVQTSASIPFIFSDGTSLKASIESAFPTLKGRVTVVTIGSEGKTGGSLSPAASGPGAAGTAAPSTNVSADDSTSPESLAQGGYTRLIPKGGVVNVAASPEEIEAVRNLINATETALTEAPYREQVAQGKRLAGLTTEVYRIKYASAPDLIQVLQQLAPNVNVTPGPTQGFQTTSTGQSLTYTAAPIVTAGGVVGTTPGAPASGGPANTSVTVTNRTLSLLLTAVPEELARAQEILNRIDVRSPQLIFEAKVVDINQEDLLNLGIQYPETKSGINVGVGENGPSARPLLGSFGALYRTPVGFNANLFAAINNNKGKVLSNPNLTALDGQTATAFIGDQIKYVTQIQQTPQGQTVTTETATVGITLKVTGRYSPDGTITLYVHPEVSAISSFLAISQGISLPQISTRYVDTTVRVKDGETIGIGGLIRNNEVKNLQRIPLLSDIPFFGELFKFRSNTKQQSEIVVFITSRLAPE